MRPVRAVVVLLCLPLLLSACSSSPDAPAEPELPAESAFAAGTCQEAAPDLLELGRTLPRLGEGPTVDADVQASLGELQDRLVLFQETAEPEVGVLLSTLVERIGGVRIRAVGNTYEPSLGEDLSQAYDEVLSTCTAD